MGRAPCCDKANVKKGPWSPEEDRKLKEYIQTHGTGGNWIALPQKAGLRRCGKSCRLRWLNYLRPNIKHGEFSDDEDKVICTLFASIGSRWSIMAAQLPGRTDNDIKNYWNTKLKKKMMMNSLISMPPHEIRKKPLHHLQSFNSSTNYSYPSLSIFHNTHINNVNASSSSSPPSSYVYSTNTNTSSSYHDQTLSIQSSPTTTAAAAAVLQSQDYGYLDSGPIQQGVKDSSTLLVMFGGGNKSAATSSSNSDGSCHYEYAAAGGGGGGVYDHHNNNNNNNIMGNLKSEEFGEGDPSLDSCLEEIKQLISTNLCSSSNIINDNNLNFFVDETKEDVDKLMYY